MASDPLLRGALISPAQAHQWLTATLWPWAKGMLMAGNRLTIEVRQPQRSSPQNARLHAMLHELAQRMDWHGQKFPLETWKRLCMAA
jgi:hypothetical protein